MQDAATPPPKFIRFPEVIRRTSKSRAAIYSLMATGEFPKPVTLGPKSVAFVESDIIAWMNNLIAERDQTEGVSE